MDEINELLGITGKKYEIVARASHPINLVASWVVTSNKIGTGKGESKRHVGVDLIKSKFFNWPDNNIKCFVLKTDLLEYLNASKNEYFSPSQEYREKEHLPDLWRERYDEVEKKEDVIFFIAHTKEELKDGKKRPYISLNDSKKDPNIIRKIALANCGYVDIIKVRKDGETSYYWKPVFEPPKLAAPSSQRSDAWPIISERFVVKKCTDSLCGHTAVPHPPIVTISDTDVCNFFGYQDGQNRYLTVTFSGLTELHTLTPKDMKCELQFSASSALGSALLKIPNKEVDNTFLIFIKCRSIFRAYILKKEKGELPSEEDIAMFIYTKEDFLNEVFITDVEYDSLRALLLRKKNVILQGPPGVGKTFSAKRLAYSIIGGKDDNYISVVQFHQNYSYEDFIQGYRPTPKGFVLKCGPFYNFCQKAAQDPQNPYFFIIDEINRGNLSKIFGELLMLIENDKRMDENHHGEKLRLLYSEDDSEEYFSVPANLYIIGMMNTADRSLAMIDYALRRRFSFYELRPAFTSPQFNTIMADNPRFIKVRDAIVNLNEEIRKDSSLGPGCMIGHSYFCNPDEDIDLWLQNVVKYEIIPLVKEYWYDNEERCNKEINSLFTAAGISE